MKNITILGSTGSVGRNVLDVIRSYPGMFRVKALSSNENISSLLEQAEEFKPASVVIAREEFYSEFKKKCPFGVKIFSGPEFLEEAAREKDTDIIFMAISGTHALKPLMAALSAGKTVALASKEPVVSAGEIIQAALKKYGSRILPVDSEHSAAAQCLSGKSKDYVKTLYITGSGGPLRERPLEEFDSLSINEVLNHPVWKMGRKITVDSATLMNKGLEVIEARWLFDIPSDKIKIVIHPESVVHSMVEFIDGTINAGLSCPDMRFPILKALFFPEMVENSFPRVDFNIVNKLSFFEADTEKFPAINIALSALESGGTYPAVLNSSNEAAVKCFLEGKAKFTDIMKLITKVMEKHQSVNNPSLEQILSAEEWAEKEVSRFC
ncbi:MAG: 1-deoxy-D-xylulose-5-phosphate reductoisomerase [Candidatus Omnitrophota bacterium]